MCVLVRACEFEYLCVFRYTHGSVDIKIINGYVRAHVCICMCMCGHRNGFYIDFCLWGVSD